MSIETLKAELEAIELWDAEYRRQVGEHLGQKDSLWRGRHVASKF